MTKSQVVDLVARQANLSKREAEDALDAVLDAIQDALRRGSDVTFQGFGKFSVAERGARKGRNPRTGATIEIAATRVPRFTAGAGLKSAVKG